MLEDPTVWLLVGLIGGAIWARYASWVGIPRILLVALSPLAAVSTVLPLFALRQGFRHTWTLLPLLWAAMPAVVASVITMRRCYATHFHRWRLIGAMVLVPGMGVCILGLCPGSVRYADAMHTVDRVAPVVERFIRDRHRCPEFGEILPAMTGPYEPDPARNSYADALYFVCEAPRFGFCFRRPPFEEPVQCWDSESGKWWFERAFLRARP